MLDEKKVWQDCLELIKNEMAEVSFNTWFGDMELISIIDQTVTLMVNNQFAKGIVNDRYASLIQNALKQITKNEYLIQITVPGETTDQQQKQAPKPTIKSDLPNKSNLNPKNTFDRFVIGNSNRFAHAASLAVAESPANAYNPLFIYGGVGLGKTHLMHAVGHFILNQNPNANVVYVSSEKFTNDLIESIRNNKNSEFRNKYRSIDVLLIDDIQFIAKKERTQEEFFHTFNALHESNKQIIISSDRPPKEIPTLEDRLRSRFEWGLIADIQEPDLETRIAILRKRAELENLSVSDEVIQFIADKVQSNIRELEGALTRVMAYTSLTNETITVDVAAEALKDIISIKKPKQINIPRIKELVANQYNIRIEDFNSKKRSRAIAFPRQIAMFLTRELTDLSLPKIGEEFGGRDHTTVMHACDKISNQMSEDRQFKTEIDTLVDSLRNN